MNIINRTGKGFVIAGAEVNGTTTIHVRRSEEFHIGKRLCGELELDGFTPEELRDMHGLLASCDVVESIVAKLPAAVTALPAIATMASTTTQMRKHITTELPSLELLAQLEAEQDDGFYLYPRAAAAS